jgi:hypothetical protein
MTSRPVGLLTRVITTPFHTRILLITTSGRAGCFTRLYKSAEVYRGKARKSLPQQTSWRICRVLLKISPAADFKSSGRFPLAAPFPIAVSLAATSNVSFFPP